MEVIFVVEGRPRCSSLLAQRSWSLEAGLLFYRISVPLGLLPAESFHCCRFVNFRVPICEPLKSAWPLPTSLKDALLD